MNYVGLLFIIIIVYVLVTKLMELINAARFNNSKIGISLPNMLDIEGLYQIIKSNFQFPNLKSVERNAHYQIVIYGKHGAYTFNVHDEMIHIIPHSKSFISGLFGSKLILTLESEIIRTSLIKMLDENGVLDVYKRHSMLQKKIRNQRLVPYVISILFILVIVSLFVSPDTKDVMKDVTHQLVKEADGKLNETFEDSKVAKVKNAYLNQYSNSVTIGNAFKAFLTASKWVSKSTSDGQELIVYTGILNVEGKDTDATINFKINNDGFEINSLLFDNELQSLEQLTSLLETIYKNQSVTPLNLDASSTATSKINLDTQENIGTATLPSPNLEVIPKTETIIISSLEPAKSNPHDSLYKGRIPGIPSGIGDTTSNLVDLNGEVIKKVMDGNGFAFQFSNVIYYTTAVSTVNGTMIDGEVTSMLFIKGYSFLGITIGETPDSIIDTLGQPDESGIGGENGDFSMTYKFGDYNLYISSPDKNLATTQALYKLN